MKTCSKCKIEKPFEAFYKSKKSTDRYAYACIECKKLRELEFKKNPLMQLEKQIRSSVILENKLLQRENKKLCFKCKEIFLIDDLSNSGACKECEKERLKEYHEKNKEKIKEQTREYRKKNKEKMNKQTMEYYEKNKEKIKESRREYYEKNKEKWRDDNRKYRLKKKLEKQNNT